jgi:glycosyltransferase involved in cell wall biosynthesis
MKTPQPLVSIIVPCYNQSHYLNDALNSILSQTHSHWECIVVNDGSTDATAQMAGEWAAKDSRFKYISQGNRGLSAARNAGLEQAAGEYIQLLDADDLLETDKIRHQIAYLNNNGNGIDIVVSGYRYFQDSDPSRELLIFGPFDLLPEVVVTREDKRDLVKLFAKTNPMVVSAPLYHKSVFGRIGLFDEDLGANEDWDLHFRCVSNGIVFQHSGYAPNSRTLIRIHDKSMTADRDNMIRNLRKFQRKHSKNRDFALANGLVITGFRSALLYFIRMYVSPVLIRLAKRMLGMA